MTDLSMIETSDLEEYYRAYVTLDELKCGGMLQYHVDQEKIDREVDNYMKSLVSIPIDLPEDIADELEKLV